MPDFATQLFIRFNDTRVHTYTAKKLIFNELVFTVNQRLFKRNSVFWKVIILFSFSFYQSSAEISLCSWNLKDFGKTKDPTEIEFIATTIKEYDIIAIQEVVAGDGGAQAVARLSDQLNRMGANWEYVISDPTSGSNKKERYAFIWKTSRIQSIGKAWLDIKYGDEIEREPFFITVNADGKIVTLCNFHAITKSMHPETEVKYFKFIPKDHPDKNIIFCGDFNLPQSHTVFNPLKSMGFKPALELQKTSLRQACINDDCLASEYDNVFFDGRKVKLIKADIIHFYLNFASIKDALMISDHVPVVFRFSI